jgi:hypothetical protein
MAQPQPFRASNGHGLIHFGRCNVAFDPLKPINQASAVLNTASPAVGPYPPRSDSTPPSPSARPS